MFLWHYGIISLSPNCVSLNFVVLCWFSSCLNWHDRLRSAAAADIWSFFSCDLALLHCVQEGVTAERRGRLNVIRWHSFWKINQTETGFTGKIIEHTLCILKETCSISVFTKMKAILKLKLILMFPYLVKIVVTNRGYQLQLLFTLLTFSLWPLV